MSIDRNSQLENLFSVMNNDDTKEDKKLLSKTPSLSSSEEDKPLTAHEALNRVIKIATTKTSKLNDVTKNKIKKKTKSAFIEYLEMFYTASFDENKL